MVDMHFYEQMSDEELLVELHDQQCGFFLLLDELASQAPLDEQEDIRKGEEVARRCRLIVKIELLAEKRGLKYD